MCVLSSHERNKKLVWWIERRLSYSSTFASSSSKNVLKCLTLSPAIFDKLKRTNIANRCAYSGASLLPCPLIDIGGCHFHRENSWHSIAKHARQAQQRKKGVTHVCFHKVLHLLAVPWDVANLSAWKCCDRWFLQNVAFVAFAVKCGTCSSSESVAMFSFRKIVVLVSSTPRCCFC